MKTAPFYVAVAVLNMLTFFTMHAQKVEIAYRERRPGLTESGKLFMHGKSSLLFLAINRLGVFTLSGPSLTPVAIPATQGADGYEYQYVCDCSNGDILLHQRGFLGNRIFRIDEHGIASKIVIDDGELSEVSLRGNGVARGTITRLDGSYTGYTTLDCGNTWFADSGSAAVLAGAMRTKVNNPVRLKIARPGLGNQSYPSSMKTEASFLHSSALLGTDSVLWIANRSRSTKPDTVFYADIRDSSLKRIDTVLRVAGVSDTIKFDVVHFSSTNNGNAFLFHDLGWYARYNKGTWTAQDTLLPSNNSQTSQLDSVLRYISTFKTGSRLVTVFLDSSSVNTNEEIESPPGPINSIGVVSAEYTSLSYDKATTPLCLYSSSGGRQIINSVVRDISFLPPTPILLGFTNPVGTPIVVPVSDCSVLTSESKLGLLQSTTTRGESWILTRFHGPRIQSTQGLRTPSVGKDEVIFPGDKVRQFTREGKYIRTISSDPATSILRLGDSTLMVANQASIRFISANGVIDSIDITTTLCTDTNIAGFIGSMLHAADGTLIAFVSGLRLLDLETLSSIPLRCGGVVRSKDSGRSWTSAAIPLESPYFLSCLLSPTGTMVASISTVIRDSTTQISDDQEPALESKNHTFNDRIVIRSTDNGATWSQVYKTTSGSSFGLIGGSGVIAEDGALLLMTTDGVLQSTNDGLDWDYREIDGMDPGTKVISMFQHSSRSTVYYCADVGLYRDQTTTEVMETQTMNPRNFSARTWSNHLSVWRQNKQEVTRLFSILGVEMSSLNPPAGLYFAEFSVQSKSKLEPILVLSE